MWWNHVIWCCFHGEKCFTSYLHIGSTLEYNSNRFWKLQCRTTIFILLPFWATGHVTTLLMTHWMDPDSSQWKCQEQWKVVNEKGWAAMKKVLTWSEKHSMKSAMKSSQLKGLACNEKQPMKIQAAMKSHQWKGLACNEKCRQQWKATNEKFCAAMTSAQWKRLASNEKQPIKRIGQQWKVVNENGWTAMKSS